MYATHVTKQDLQYCRCISAAGRQLIVDICCGKWNGIEDWLLWSKMDELVKINRIVLLVNRLFVIWGATLKLRLYFSLITISPFCHQHFYLNIYTLEKRKKILGY